MKPHLEKLAKIAQDETYITYDELEGWPREQLEEEGYLKEAGLQSAITCDQCSERCPIPRDRVIRRKDDESMGLLPCEYNPDISFVDVNLDRYKQYRIIKRKLRAEGYYQEPEETPRDNGKNNNVFRPNGDFWQIVFQGKRVPPIRRNKRMLYIVELLKNPHKEISALELCRMVNRTEQQISGKEDYAGEDDHSTSTKTGLKREESLNAIDDTAVKEYQARLEELRGDLDKAKDSNNDSEEIRIQGEIDFITQELTSNHGVGGRLRKFADERKRAKDTARVSINRAKNDIKPHSEELFQHLENTIRTGDTCSYKPDQGIDWQF